MKTCISTFLYALVLLIVAGTVTDVIDHHVSGIQVPYAEAPADWEGEAGEAEDDTSFEDDFTHSMVAAFCPISDFSNGLMTHGHPKFNEHFGEIPSPPPQA